MSNLTQAIQATGLSLINPVQHPERECPHTKELELDEEARLLYCKSCGEVVDPIEFVAWLMNREHKIVAEARNRAAQLRRLRQDVDSKKDELRILNEEITAKRSQLDAIQGELGKSLPLALGFSSNSSKAAKFEGLRGLLGEGGL